VTRIGILASAATLLVLAGLSVALGGRLFSPGALNAHAGQAALDGVRSHAETGGHCAACHAAPWSSSTMADRCVACHTDVAAQLQDPTSLHGALKARTLSSWCRGCHTEHKGPTGSLTNLDPKSFPHEATGYSLQAHGKTAQGVAFACQDCHISPGSFRFDISTCDVCHRQIDASFVQAHEQAYSTACLGCHDGVDTYGKQFDHAKQAFALVGKHVAVPCAGCHQGAKTPADLKAAPQQCFACHQKDDPHQGQFGQDCGGCHTPVDWKLATFDHSKSAFPLVGKHQQVECTQCHVNSVFKGTPTNCFACHQKDDPHQGQFGQDCGGCHTPVDWKQVTFDHSKAAFPLTGAHLQVDCVKCHVNNVFKGTPTQCTACHAEPDLHKGLLGTDCAACHTTDAWSPAKLNQPHPFPFDHGSTGPSPCRTCHPTTLGQYTCYGCHAHDPAQTAARHREEGITDLTNCARCHSGGQREGGG
jgi:hypothetical protein